MSSLPATPKPLPRFMPALAIALVLLVLLQGVGRTTWMLIPPGILALGALLPFSRAPGLFFASLPVALMFETTGAGPEELIDSLFSGLGFRRMGLPSLADLELDDFPSIGLWLAIALAWIHGFRELAHLAMTKGDPFPGPKGRKGPSPLHRTMPRTAGDRRGVTVGLVSLCVGILMVIILQAAALSGELGHAAILRTRLATLGGGAILVFLAVRVATGYMHWRSMSGLEAVLTAQEGAWREGAREFGALDRWLTWVRLGMRRRAERRWTNLIRRRAKP